MEIRNQKHTLTVEDADLSGSAFRGVNLSGCRFLDADLSNAAFEDVNLGGAKFRDINFSGVEVNDCNLAGMRIDGVHVAEAVDAFRNARPLADRESAEPAVQPVASPAGVADIRPFREADRPGVVALWESVFGYPAPHNNPATVIRQKLKVGPDLLVVAAREGKVVGTAMGGYDGHRGWVYSLAVHPDHRRRGIATALVRHVERALSARGCRKVNLQVLASNAPTVAFYQKLGYGVEERVSMGKLL